MTSGLPDLNRRNFNIRPLRREEVLKELRQLRNDCSTVPDQIPVKMLKLIAEILVSPLTNIFKSVIEKRLLLIAIKLHIFVLSQIGLKSTVNKI